MTFRVEQARCWFQQPPLMRYALLFDNYSGQWKGFEREQRVGHLRYLWKHR